jgi:hypothetical protein
MANDVALQMSFEEKFRDRIKNHIGELMTDEDIKKILNAGIQKYLFEPRPVKTDHWHGESECPSLVQEVIEKHLHSEVENAVNGWIIDHPDDMKMFVQNAIGAGMGKCFMEYLNHHFAGMAKMVVEQMHQNGMLPKV